MAAHHSALSHWTPEQVAVRARRTAAALPPAHTTVTEVLRAAAALQAVCEQHQWRYCFIGGLAVLRWGEPRETVDVALTLLTGFGGEEVFINTLVTQFEARREDAIEFARVNRVLLLRAPSGVGLDIALGGLPFEESAVARSSMFEFVHGISLRTCSAEDLLVLKTFADRPKDWVDVDGVLIRQKSQLDWADLLNQLAPLAELKDASELVDRLERRRQELEG